MTRKTIRTVTTNGKNPTVTFHDNGSVGLWTTGMGGPMGTRDDALAVLNVLQQALAPTVLIVQSGDISPEQLDELRSDVQAGVMSAEDVRGEFSQILTNASEQIQWVRTDTHLQEWIGVCRGVRVASIQRYLRRQEWWVAIWEQGEIVDSNDDHDRGSTTTEQAAKDLASTMFAKQLALRTVGKFFDRQDSESESESSAALSYVREELEYHNLKIPYGSEEYHFVAMLINAQQRTGGEVEWFQDTRVDDSIDAHLDTAKRGKPERCWRMRNGNDYVEWVFGFRNGMFIGGETDDPSAVEGEVG